MASLAISPNSSRKLIVMEMLQRPLAYSRQFLKKTLSPERIRYLRLIWLMIKRELKVKYRETVLGYLWSMLNPLLFMIIISFVFGHLIRDIPNYNLYVLSGFLVWGLTQVGMHLGVASITNSAHLLRKIKLPIWIFPIIPLGSCLLNLALSLIPYILVYSFSGRGVPEYWYLAPFVALSLVGFLAGVNLILACFNVFFRDIQHVLEPVLSLVFYATPIIFSRQNEMVPPKVAELLGWNPMTHYVEVFRNCVFHTENVVSPYQFLLVMLLPIPSLAIGWLVYKKTRRHILFRI